MIAQSEIDNMS